MLEPVTLAFRVCEPCRLRKKKCDRLLPTCTACTNKSLRCLYEEQKTQDELRKLRVQVKNLTNTVKNKSMHICLPTPIHLSEVNQYPIPSRWYMPFLLQHYWELCFPTFSRTDPTGDCISPPNSWMQAAFSDPCMFHAVLFSISSRIDVLRAEKDNPVTFYHRCCATRLLLDNISSGRTPSLPTIVATTYLWHYETISSHVHEAEIHKRGLRQMVKSRGGLSSLGFDGFLAQQIILMDIAEAIVTASIPSFADFVSIPLPEAPVTLLSAILSKRKRDLITYGISTSLIRRLHYVHGATLQFESQRLKSKQILSNGSWSASSSEEISKPVFEDNEEDSFCDDLEGNSLQLAARYAANIHLKSLGRVIPFSSEDNQGFVSRLRYYLSQLTDDIWLNNNREIYIWLCLTGAAAAQEGKTWFLTKVGPVIMSLEHDKLRMVKSGALRFCSQIQYLEEVNVGK
ncbi:hypothetical protein F5884DRAFT_788585 [Xylogone sp. PMI_703]|nr:hypothetical protein F5884DRAFT_788585 [Xylogone sp. PMI_703]